MDGDNTSNRYDQLSDRERKKLFSKLADILHIDDAVYDDILEILSRYNNQVLPTDIADDEQVHEGVVVGGVTILT